MKKVSITGQQASQGGEDGESDVNLKKVYRPLGAEENGSQQQAKVVGGATGPGYNFTGITPGSECSNSRSDHTG